MKIRFGATYSGGGCMALICFYLSAIALVTSYFILHPLGVCPGPPVQSQMPNITSTIAHILSCNLPYQKCLCSLLSNKTGNSTTCVSDIVYECGRILPLVSFVLYICIIQELFTLDGDSSRELVRRARISCLFIFICLTIGIYWNSCYHHFIIILLHLTSSPLGIFAAHDMNLSNKDPERFRRNNNIVTYTNQSERHGNDVKSWQELL